MQHHCSPMQLASLADVLGLVTLVGGTRDKPKNVCVGGRELAIGEISDRETIS